MVQKTTEKKPDWQKLWIFLVKKLRTLIRNELLQLPDRRGLILNLSNVSRVDLTENLKSGCPTPKIAKNRQKVPKDYQKSQIFTKNYGKLVKNCVPWSVMNYYSCQIVEAWSWIWAMCLVHVGLTENLKSGCPTPKIAKKCQKTTKKARFWPKIMKN